MSVDYFSSESSLGTAIFLQSLSNNKKSLLLLKTSGSHHPSIVWLEMFLFRKPKQQKYNFYIAVSVITISLFDENIFNLSSNTKMNRD